MSHDVREDNLRSLLATSVDSLRIMEPPVSDIVERATRDSIRRTRRRRGVVAIAALLCLCVAGVAVSREQNQTVDVAGDPSGTVPMPDPTAVTRVVLDGWSIDRYFSSSHGAGQPYAAAWTYVEYQFEQGDRRLQISFYPAEERRTDQAPNIEVRGTRGTLLESGGGRYRVNWQESGFTWEADGGPFGDAASFVAAVDQVHQVDVSTWQAAMPKDVVLPSDRPAAVDKLLEGVPLPPAFDVDALRRSDQPTGTYDLGVEVLGKGVACAWIAEWRQHRGTPAGDDAVRALATSRTWKGLIDMTAQGDYSAVVWQIADGLASGETAVVSGADQSLGCH
jgi:hypothetical protein